MLNRSWKRKLLSDVQETQNLKHQKHSSWFIRNNSTQIADILSLNAAATNIENTNQSLTDIVEGIPSIRPNEINIKVNKVSHKPEGVAEILTTKHPETKEAIKLTPEGQGEMYFTKSPRSYYPKCKPIPEGSKEMPTQRSPHSYRKCYCGECCYCSSKKQEEDKSCKAEFNSRNVIPFNPPILSSGYPESKTIDYRPKLTKSQRDINTQTIKYPAKFKCDCCKIRHYKMSDHFELTDRRKLVESGYWSEPSCHKLFEKKIENKPPKYPDVADFRNKNYKDTHATETVLDQIDIPLHTCLHPYKLSDDLFLEPINTKECTDHSCTHLNPSTCERRKSKCLTCNLPLITEKEFLKKPGSGIDNYEWKYIQKRELLRKKMERYTPQEIVVRIPVTTKKLEHVIIPRFRTSSVNTSNRFKFQIPKPHPQPILPKDSFALRFQEGMKTYV